MDMIGLLSVRVGRAIPGYHVTGELQSAWSSDPGQKKRKRKMRKKKRKRRPGAR
jgi:hypothetical protein